jgi:hypothetical protein
MGNRKFSPAFPGDVDPTEFIEAMQGGDIQAPPDAMMMRGAAGSLEEEAARVHQGEPQAPRPAQVPSGGKDTKEALRDFLKAGQRLLEAMEREQS